MRKLSILCLLWVFVIGVMAQTPMKHEKRTYIDPEGSFYINKDLPVYLRLSTSPDESAKSQLLQSKSTAKYANPLYFDTEGLNTVRTPSCVDKETRKTAVPVRDVVFEVYADGLPPISSSAFSGAPKYVKGGIIYYGKNLVVNITSKDAVSGVEKTFYALNIANKKGSETFKDYTSSVTLNMEGANILKYYAADNVGNAETPKSKNFTVDLTSPETSYGISGPQLGDIFSPKCKITLSSTDNLSGVQKTLYAWDGKSEYKYYTAVSFSSLGDGQHSLAYYSIDNVKNAEDKAKTAGAFGQSGKGSGVYKFYLDKIPPDVNATIEGDQYIGNYKYISSRTKIKLTATDNKAGVASINYQIDYKRVNTYSEPFLVTNVKGLHPITYYATDKVDNVSAKKTLTVYMDNVPPTTSISYGTPQFFDRDTLFINNTTKVTLTARDYESGVLKTDYNIDNTRANAYGAPFVIPNEGFRKIVFSSTDRVNNKEQDKESVVYVDNTPPVIYTNLSIQPVGTKKKDSKDYDVYPNYTRLYVGATDKKSGTARILYSINGSDFRDYSSPYTLDVSELNLFKTKKFYTVVIKAKDKLGNESEKTVEFFVGKE